MRAPPGLALLTCGVAVGGRYACEALWGAGDAWQRGIEVASALAGGAVVAHFTAGDPPRRPWLVLTLALALIPVIRLASWMQWSVAEVSLKSGILIVGNVIFAAAMLGFSRVLGSSDLLSERTAEARVKAMLTVGAIAACGLAFIGYNVFELAARGVPTTRDAWASAIASGFSTISDAIVFAGGLYLVWLLRPMVGGSLARPYLLMAAGGAAFLVVDVMLIAAGATAQTDIADTTAKLIGTLAYSCFAAAALVQVALLRAGRRGG